ncbi:MAG: radical SAM protein, partial [Candidatus Vecturithrix sp.]|nr:radical SAM protein [Candidatus Vecturithrix sp.]
MGQTAQHIAFGPVPSRRLGQSLGINNIPPKTCSYSCVYCQLGRTLKMQITREVFYDPDEIFREVEQKVEQSREKGEAIDYLTYVADGEPTLDLQLDREIKLLRDLGCQIAVITNASLLWMLDVREALRLADWVSVKIDALTPEIWHRIDRPYGALQLDTI